MFNSDKDVMSNYISMYGAPDFTFNYSNPDVSDDPQAHKIFDELKKKYNDGSIKVDDYMQVKNYNLINIKSLLSVRISIISLVSRMVTIL